MEKKVTSNIKLFGAKLIFKNFKGKGGEYNDEGDRNFCVIIEDEDMASQLAEDGWNIKRLKPNPDADDPNYCVPYLPVKVRFNKIPPIAVLITSKGKIKLDEDTIDQLDWTHMKNVDLIIRPYNYQAMRGRPAGVSAYLKSIYVEVYEDDLESKYADIPYINE